MLIRLAQGQEEVTMTTVLYYCLLTGELVIQVHLMTVVKSDEIQFTYQKQLSVLAVLICNPQVEFQKNLKANKMMLFCCIKYTEYK